jgi:hypothetical protein
MRLRAAASASLGSARPRRLLEDALCRDPLLILRADAFRAVLTAAPPFSNRPSFLAVAPTADVTRVLLEGPAENADLGELLVALSF